MSGPTCCCVSLDRRDRCDLLVGLEDFHLMSVARTPDIVVLDVESCNQLAGCPGCGVICSRPRARLGARVIRWAIRQLRFEGATIAGLARQLATTWNIVWSHIKPCLITLPVLRGFGYWGLMSMCGITRTDAAGVPVSSLASWT